MSINVKSGGVFRTPSQVWVKAGGVWRNCTSVWERSAGVWRQVFSAGGAVVQPFTAWHVLREVVFGGGIAAGTLNVNSDGTVTGSGTGLNSDTPGSPRWFNPATGGIGSSYWVRATVTSGTVTSGTVGSWVNLVSGASWTKSSTLGAGTVTLTLEIATDSGGSNVVFTSTGNTIAFDHNA